VSSPGESGGSKKLQEMLSAATNGNRLALARLLSVVEQGGQAARDLDSLLASEQAKGEQAGGNSAKAKPSELLDPGVSVPASVPAVVGITGAPGAGKSTLTSALVGIARSESRTVAVVAVDPTSPLSGGAILGDRVRMQDHALDPGVFIRSMATRGHLGGLAVAVPQAIRLLESIGFDLILIETVGVGQVEVEIAGQADTTVVVVTPGWGDSIQANKAGLLEVADLFVVNKADRPGAREAQRDLERMLDLAPPERYRPEVLSVSATSGTGMAELWEALWRHRKWLVETGALGKRRMRRQVEEIERIALDEVRQLIHANARLLGELGSESVGVYEGARRLLDFLGLKEAPSQRL
jgi:LAO/AO transport system kinase